MMNTPSHTRSFITIEPSAALLIHFLGATILRKCANYKIREPFLKGKVSTVDIHVLTAGFDTANLIHFLIKQATLTYCAFPFS
jgi:hypothetical protein